MCFSAQASFTAAAFIGTVGVASVFRTKPSLRLLAFTPLLFAFQQGVEGIIWLTLDSGGAPGLLNKISTYLFLIFATLFWPLWIPSVLCGIEKKPRRKAWLKLNVGIGCLVVLLSFLWFFLLGATSEILGHHIGYGRRVDSLPFLPPDVLGALYYGVSLLYLWATMGSFFLSSLRGAWLIGVLLGLSYLISSLIFAETLTSVWCFFVACLSITLFFVVKR